MTDTPTNQTSYDFQRELDAFLRGKETAAPAADEQQPQEYWEKLFNNMNFPGMDLMAVTYFNLSMDDVLEQRKILRKTIQDFLKLIGYNNTNDLRSAGVSEEGIFYIRKGKLPENYTVHLKYPLEYGGRIDFNNMVFIQNRPFHELIHTYIDKQLIGPNGSLRPRQLYVPVPLGKIYVPFGGITGSGGKNKQDRSALAGYTQSALTELALRKMPGR